MRGPTTHGWETHQIEIIKIAVLDKETSPIYSFREWPSWHRDYFGSLPLFFLLPADVPLRSKL